MFRSMEEVLEANQKGGYYFFSPDTMRFFESRVETELYPNQCFITSEKKCFEDPTRVYAVRKALPSGAIETIQGKFETIWEAVAELEKIPTNC